MRKIILLLLLAAVVFWVTPAAAQVTTADLYGRVLDPSGAVVVNARVTVKNPDTGLTRETTSGSNGEYAVTLLPPGNYKVTVEAQGFATTVYERMELAVGSKRTLDVTLKLGSGREVVTVTEEQPLLELTSSEIRGSVTPLEVKELPILDRNFASLTRHAGDAPSGGF